jgi:hypothetical protein
MEVEVSWFYVAGVLRGATGTVQAPGQRVAAAVREKGGALDDRW